MPAAFVWEDSMKTPTMVIALSTASLIGAACTTTPVSTARTVRYVCDRGPSLTVIFEKEKAAVTPDGGETVTLPQAPTGSGFLYMTPQHSLRGKGDEASWTVGRMVPIQCKAA
jgi:membrane-bound inhibitor of C-type lysozyme